MDIITEERTTRIDAAIKAWLAAKRRRSDSVATEGAYRRAITAFRARLRAQGKDLDLAHWADRHDEDTWGAMLAEFTAEVEDFADHFTYDPSLHTANSTYAARISALRSFYKFALARRHFVRYPNPIDDIERPATPAYSKVKALDPRDIAVAMQAIDRTTLQGKRDYALLCVFLETAQRKSAVQMLHWKDVELLGRLEDIKLPEDIKLILTFPRVKGNRAMPRYELSHLASKALLEWLAHIYQMNPLSLHGDRPLWVNLRNIGFVKELEQLSNNGITLICKTRIGTTHVHKLRHTVAQQCLVAGMPITDIQQLLGHANLATLTVYLEALSPPATNSKIAALDAVFGIR